MPDRGCVDFFLGANSPTGFYSLFGNAYDAQSGWRAFVIKGGPGTGKSTLMKRLAAAFSDRGEYVEKAWCSSDPQSLDAVILPHRRSIILDGTAPHVIEPKYPGVCERIVDIGSAWDTAVLRETGAQIIALGEQCARCHAQAQSFLAAARPFLEQNAAIAGSYADLQKAKAFATRLCEKLFGQVKEGGGEIELRMLSAVTQMGISIFEKTPQSLCERVIVLEDRYNAVAASFMTAVRDWLVSHGEDIICCICSQMHTPEHIIVPKKKICISVSNSFHKLSGSERIIHSERFMRERPDKETRRELVRNERVLELMYAQAADCMRKAKVIHDQLEQFYIRAMDYSALEPIYEMLLEQMI